MKKTIFSLFVMSLIVFTGVASADVEKTEGFVCPVLNENVGMHNPNTFEIGEGDYSLIPSGEPHTISIPSHVTNGEGSGSPGGSHANPGDTDYTAIWPS